MEVKKNQHQNVGFNWVGRVQWPLRRSSAHFATRL